MTDKIVVLSTCEGGEEARRIARLLVERRLAACVNIVPQITSVYRWKGEVEEASEHLLVIKTTRSMVADVRSAIEQVHSYELPELIAVPIVDGSDRYLEWIEENLTRTGGSSR